MRLHPLSARRRTTAALVEQQPISTQAQAAAVVLADQMGQVVLVVEHQMEAPLVVAAAVPLTMATQAERLRRRQVQRAARLGQMQAAQVVPEAARIKAARERTVLAQAAAPVLSAVQAVQAITVAKNLCGHLRQAGLLGRHLGLALVVLVHQAPMGLLV